MTILQMVPQNSSVHEHIKLVDEKHEDGHVRLRADIRALEVDVEALKAAHAELAARVLRQAEKPIEIDQVKVSSKQVVAIVVATVSIFSANYASTYGLRSDVRDIKTIVDNLTRYQDSQVAELRKAYDVLVKEQALQRVRLEETRNELAKIDGLMSGRKR